MSRWHCKIFTCPAENGSLTRRAVLLPCSELVTDLSTEPLRIRLILLLYLYLHFRNVLLGHRGNHVVLCSNFCSTLVVFYRGWCFSDKGLCSQCKGMLSQRSLIKSDISSLFVGSPPLFFFKTTKDKLFSDVFFGGLHEDSVRNSQLNSSWQRHHC